MTDHPTRRGGRPPRRVATADAAALAGYRDLIGAERHRDGDRLDGVFVVEGIRAIGQLLDRGWPVESIMLSTAREARRPDIVRDATEAGVQVYVAEQEVFDRITGYHAHRGALALARRPTVRSVASVVENARLVLAIEGVNDHENVGSLFRNAAAFGVGAVVLGPSTAEPLYRRSVRVSVGHVLSIPFGRARAWPDDVAALREMGFRVLALTPAGQIDVATLSGSMGAGRCVLLVGAEGDGLSREALAEADLTVRIPMAEGVDSLNVATAAAVALHHLARL